MKTAEEQNREYWGRKVTPTWDKDAMSEAMRQFVKEGRDQLPAEVMDYVASNLQPAVDSDARGKYTTIVSAVEKSSLFQNVLDQLNGKKKAAAGKIIFEARFTLSQATEQQKGYGQMEHSRFYAADTGELILEF